jgi:hypothetical protein
MIGLSQRDASSPDDAQRVSFCRGGRFDRCVFAGLGCELMFVLATLRRSAHQRRLRGRPPLRACAEAANMADFSLIPIRSVLHAAEMKTILSRRLLLPSTATGERPLAGFAAGWLVPRRSGC